MSEIDEEEDYDFKDHYRKILRKLYAEQEIEKKSVSKVERPNPERLVQHRGSIREPGNLLTSFRQFVQDYETLVQVLIMLPIVLTILYIVFVEEGSILRNTYNKSKEKS